jgi:arylsulfatase A-like enzyme
MKFTIFLSALLLAPLAALHAADAPKEVAKPNIVVILADDLGYADLGCQGSPDVKTPNMNSLAANGVRCTAGYVTAPQCSPSRAGLLSGQYQQRFGHEGNPQFPVMLMRGGKTIADHLKAVGYATAHYGKWHLGFEDKESAPKEMVEKGDWLAPTQHGFDESSGYADYAKVARKGSDILPALHARDDRVFGRKAVDFIARRRAEPCFIYLAFHAPHYQQVDFGGYKERFPVAAPGRLGVLTVMAQQDDAVGLLLKALRDYGLETNTLLFYISDNGGTRTPDMRSDSKHFRGSLNAPFSGKKGSSLEGGIREPFLIQWKSRLPAGTTYDRAVSTLDVLPTAVAAAQAEPLDGVQLDGVNLLPFLEGKNTADPHEVLFWRWRAEQAIRMGDWKLLRCGGKHGGTEPKQWRLTNLSQDVKEEHDLTAKYPEKAKELLERFEKWGSVLPPVGPSFKDTIEGDEDESKAKKKRQHETHTPIHQRPAAGTAGRAARHRLTAPASHQAIRIAKRAEKPPLDDAARAPRELIPFFGISSGRKRRAWPPFWAPDLTNHL